MTKSATILLSLITAIMMQLMTTMVSSFSVVPAIADVQRRSCGLHSSGAVVSTKSLSWSGRQQQSFSSLTTLSLSAEDNTEENKQLATAAPGDGTVYDDEVDTAPQKKGISDAMRERLLREASAGLDADQKQTNVLLYIILGVAVLVLLGGQGIFY